MSHDTHDNHAHGASVGSYIAVFIALCVFTAVSFVANTLVHKGTMSQQTAFAIILGVAVIKATLVALIFMHVKWDWSKLYFMILPSFILAPFLIFALLPDIVLYWKSMAGK
ncbi:MAG: cytochrome C oxidase subunit IV family protein [Gemmataceae bacterium]|nr:cytochrome C oxidase subunit IV family protein [Gemmataceae bacterium]